MSELPLTKKYLGQHWLTDAASLGAICDAGGINVGDVVLEIGPGTGTLTQLLVNRAKQVIAVEFDKTLASQLHRHITSDKLCVVQQDILRFDLTSLPPDYKVVANIPYYLTSNLIRVLSETSNQASKVVLLIQKEVAERVAARPGAMSLLSVSAQFYWEIGLGQVIPAKLFTPPPKVNSQVLIMNRRAKPLFPLIDEKLFFQIVKAGFAARRKTLLNSLAGGLRTDKAQVKNLLNQAQLNPSLRAQNLSLEDWWALYTISVQQKLI